MYDALFRRESMSTSGPAFEDVEPNPLAEITNTYTSNELNQYSTIQSSGDSVQLAYDPDGNLTNDGTFQYAYDAENRLIAVTPLDSASGLKKLEFAYDYKSRRISKKVYTYMTDAWTLDSTTTFVYDGWNVIKETTTTDSGNSTEHYVWGLDLSGSLQGAGGIGGLLMRNTNTGNFLYLYDANGNAGQLVDVADGTIVARYEYDPFGNLLAADGPEADQNPFRFSTKYFGAELGLYYYGFRFYDPVLGRWPNRDPKGESGGLNLYGFVQNAPIDAVDKDGRGKYCGMIWAGAVAGASTCQDSIKNPLKPPEAALSEYLTSLTIAGLNIDYARKTYREKFSPYNYDPTTNGFNGQHCYANCLVAKRFKGNREMFGGLMDANLRYEQCTKREVCDGWCGDIGKYFQDVVSDFEADALGICGGLDDRDCVEVCKSQVHPGTGPQQPTDQASQCNEKDKECCRQVLKKQYPNLIQDNLDQLYHDLYPPSKNNYSAICPQLYQKMLIYEKMIDKQYQ